ncbi:MAG: BatD, partial [Labilithrix sp.]|nr:BatD [Labilithrix sp.]
MKVRALVLAAGLGLGAAPLTAASFPGVALAQASIDLSAGVDSDVVEVGDTLTYSLRAMVHGNASAADPKPGSTPGFTVVGASSVPVQMHTNNNGVVDNQNGLMTSWSLRADRVGTFSLGPASVVVGATRKSASAVRVRVVERGKAAPKRGPKRLDPFGDPFGANPLDPFKSLFDFGDDDRRQEAAQPATDPKLGMAEARAPVAFLHATIDKARAVVGEQVTLNVYLYEDPYARQGRPGDVHEATAADFVKRSLVEDETRAIGVGTALVGGKVWNVKLVRKNALFPIKTGHLAVEPMSMTLPQARVGLRASETLYVDVTEPPAAGRPAGYSMGDVGDMSLQANVAPRAAAQEGAIGVTIELRGTGNLPSKLTLPTVPDVEWLEQQSLDKLGPLSADRFGGTRTFSYVVRLHRAGAVDLGEVKLPFFDPQKNGYRTATAALGIVDVKPGTGRDAGVDAPEPILPGLPKERAALEGRRSETYLTDRPLFWAGLFGSPLACVLALGAQSLLGRVRERRARAAPSVGRVARDRRVEAEAALRGDDGKAA